MTVNTALSQGLEKYPHLLKPLDLGFYPAQEQGADGFHAHWS